MRRLLAAVLLALALAPAARAGGTQVAVVAAQGRLFVLNGAAVVELDPADGHVLRETRGRYHYATGLVLGGGALWLSSVENGFVSGAVTRVPLAGGRPTRPLVLPARPVYSLASDGRSAWALVGPWPDPRLARIGADGVTTFSSHGAGSLASGAGAVYGLAAPSRVVRFGPDGSATTVALVRGAAGPPVAGLGSLWVPRNPGELERLDGRTGRVLGSIDLGGSLSSVVFADGSGWAVVLHRDRFRLERIDPARMRVTTWRSIPNRGPELAFGDGRLWLADADLRVWTVDRRTLALRPFANLPG